VISPSQCPIRSILVRFPVGGLESNGFGFARCNRDLDARRALIDPAQSSPETCALIRPFLFFPATHGFPPIRRPFVQKSKSPVFCSEFVTDGCVLSFLRRQNLEFTVARQLGPDANTLILELLWLLVSGNQKTESILAFLAQQEDLEPNAWFRDDIRIAWITTLWAALGYSHPHVDACYAVLGLHPDKVYPAILARRAGLLGPHPDISVPKKPPQSIPRKRKEKTA